MNRLIYAGKFISAVALSLVLFSSCSSTPKIPPEVAAVRSKLSTLQSDPQLANRAPVAFKEAETAVQAAEKVPKDDALLDHLVWVADHKIDIAAAQAQTRYLEDQRKELAEAREKARLDSRTQEADAARADAEQARRQAEELQRQIAELNAKTTERGLVVTLGDVLFETGKSDLKEGSIVNISKLSAFLTQYPDRTVTIEGHTDSVGSEDYNLGLSQRRANAVQQFLVSQGIAPNRLSATGKGENFPVASNETSSGRQMNRRVEVIIANTKSAVQ
ncbi:porin [Cellvibrio zantedeschiae]|uniref:Porin n=1 Tax=Cellvibrio zantedeschiae TaxID=1237077 RepID=A0ABQ3B3I4_9GAMM|nr:OmpA family protein [Cellvibrio zantedeschiae]GGY77790.1 porin [Cellvibrio zantedeschiae]